MDNKDELKEVIDTVTILKNKHYQEFLKVKYLTKGILIGKSSKDI